MRQTVVLDPSAALAEVPGTGGEMLTASQVHRPPLVLHRLRIPCACGLRLAACQYTFISDTLHVHGLCLDCGMQQAIFAPSRGVEKTVEMLDVVEAMVEQANALVEWQREEQQ